MLLLGVALAASHSAQLSVEPKPSPRIIMELSEEQQRRILESRRAALQRREQGTLERRAAREQGPGPGPLTVAGSCSLLTRERYSLQWERAPLSVG